MIIFESILTTFEASFIFWASWGSIENWLKLKIKPTIGEFSFAKSLKHTVSAQSFFTAAAILGIGFTHTLLLL